MFRRVLVALSVALIVPATASAAGRSPVLGDTTTLSSSAPVSQTGAPSVASDGNTTFVVYSERLSGITLHRITASGTEIGAPRQLQQAGSGSLGAAKVAVDGQDVYVAWLQSSIFDYHAHAVVTASHDGGQTFAAPVRAGKPIESDVWDVQLAADGDTVFVSYMDAKQRLWTAGSRDGGRTFPCVAIVTPPGDESWWSWGHAIAVAGQNVYWSWLTDDFDIFARRSNDAGRTLEPAEKVLDNPYYEYPGNPALVATGDHAVLLYEKEYRWENPEQHRTDYGDEPEALVTSDKGASWAKVHLGDEASRCLGSPCATPYATAVSGSDVYVGWRGQGQMWLTASHDGGEAWTGPRVIGPYSYPHLSSPAPALSARGEVVSASWYTASDASGKDVHALGAFSDDRGQSFSLGRLGAGGSVATGAWGADPEGAAFAWLAQDGDDLNVRFAPMSATAPDVAVIDVRPFQVAQDAAQLVAGRPTTVRATVRSKSPRRETVKFKVEAGGVTREEDVVLKPGLNPVQLLADDPIVAAKGDLTAKVTVDPATSDSDPANNTGEGTRPVFTSRALRLLFVPVAEDDPQADKPACRDVRDIAEGAEEYLRASWPLDPAHLSVDVDCSTTLLHPQGLTEAGLMGQGQLLARLDRLKFAAGADKVIGVVPQGWFARQEIDGFKEAVGVAPHGGPLDTALVERQNTGGWVVAHDLAHNYGWTEVAGPHNNHLEDEPAPGYWVTEKRDIPSSTLDFMQYSTLGADVRSTTGRWMSKPTWDYLAHRLMAQAPLAGGSSLSLSGSVKDGAVDAGPMWQVDRTPDESSGPYTAEQLDAGGAVIASTAFGVADDLGPIGGDTAKGDKEIRTSIAAFSVALPAKDAARSLRVKRGSDVVLTRVRSAGAPVVKVDTPTPVAIGDDLNLTWTATDADGGVLTSQVSLLKDGSWHPLGEPTTASTLTTKALVSLAGEHVRVRVTTTDGWNTTSAESGEFAIGGTLTDGAVLATTFEHGTFAGTLAGAAPHKLFDRSGQIRYSPDGTRLAWVQGLDVYVANADGTDVRQLTHTTTAKQFYSVSWMPDGDSLLAGSTNGVMTGTYLVDARSGADTPFKTQSIRYCGPTPDGSRLLAQGTYTYSLYRVDGTFDRELPAAISPSYCPALSPDLSRVVGASGSDIVVWDAKTGAARTIAQGDDPFWSPTGEWIVWSKAGEIWKIHPDGTGAQLVMKAAEPLFAPQVQARRGLPTEPEPGREERRPHPVVTAEPGVEGKPVALHASGGESFQWDLDGDGTFTDATGAAVTTTFSDEGSFGVRVLATDAEGLAGTGDATVEVRNAAPVITDAQVSDAGVFSARVTDVDPLTATLDGKPVPVIASEGGWTVLGTGSKLVVEDPAGEQASAEARLVTAPALAAPAADDATASVAAGESVNLSLPARGDALEFEIVSRPAHGRVSLREPGSDADVTYTADNEVGTDSFTYRVRNAAGESRVATVLMDIVARADAPVITAPVPGPPLSPGSPPVARPAVVGAKPVDVAKVERATAKLEAAATFSFPSAKACVSRRHFRIRVKKPHPPGTYTSVAVWVNGKRVQSLKGKRITAAVDLRGLPKGTFTVKIAATLKTGKVVKDTRRFRTCTSKKGAKR